MIRRYLYIIQSATSRRYAFAVWTGLVTYASLASPSNMPKTGWLSFPHADKLVHFFMYFGMAWLCYFAISKTSNQVKKIVVSILIASIYGSFMELAQGVFTETRQAEWMDMLANSAGAFLGTVIAFQMEKNISLR